MKTVQVQLTFSLDEPAAKALADLLAPAIRQVIESGAREIDEKREARLRASRQVILGGETPPEGQGLLVDSRQAAKLLRISQQTLWQRYMTGEMPPPVRI